MEPGGVRSVRAGGAEDPKLEALRAEFEDVPVVQDTLGERFSVAPCWRAEIRGRDRNTLAVAVERRFEAGELAALESNLAIGTAPDSGLASRDRVDAAVEWSFECRERGEDAALAACRNGVSVVGLEGELRSRAGEDPVSPATTGRRPNSTARRGPRRGLERNPPPCEARASG